jgi:MFS family permease
MATQRFAALRHREFRLYWIGYVVSVSGQQMLWMLEGWLIYEMTGNAIYFVGSAAAQAIPATALVMLGGVFADKFDQRKLLIMVQIGNILLLGLFAALALTEWLEYWHILAIGFAHSAVGSFENPARQSMFPHLVDRVAMPNAVALNSSIHPLTRILPPALGGLILAAVFDFTGSAEVAAGSVLLITVFGIAVYTAMLTQIKMPRVERARGGTLRADMTAGARFIWDRRIFGFLISLAYFNMGFGQSMTILMPVIAKDVLGVGPDGLGLMWGAQGLGSLAGVVISSQYGSPGNQRRLLVFNPMLMGASMIAFALTPLYVASLFILFVFGTGASAANVAIQQNLQMLVPNEFRGRVMGVWSIVHTSLRPMGEMQFSGMAALLSAPVSLVASGVVVIAGALLYTAPSRYAHALKDLRQAALDEARVVR